MQEIVHRCDMPVGKSGNPCGERVPDDAPTDFGLLGQAYEADLCERHRGDLIKAMEKYVEIAKPASAPRNRPAPRRNGVRAVLKGKKGVFTQKDVREWLREQGRDVASSGRLPNELIEEYKQAQEADLV